MPSTENSRTSGTTARTRAKKGGRAALKEALPDALRNAVDTYRTLAFGPAPEDAKAFQQHQAACKAGLAHIEALLKLADATGAETSTDNAAGDDAHAMLARAEAAYASYANAVPMPNEDAEEEND